MPYSPLLIAPMRKELSSIGFTELLTAESVDAWMAQKTGTALLAVNSASGASAGFLRPALTEVLQRPIPKPERLATVSPVRMWRRPSGLAATSAMSRRPNPRSRFFLTGKWCTSYPAIGSRAEIGPT